jgi:hypothetical protein
MESMTEQLGALAGAVQRGHGDVLGLGLALDADDRAR